ncbi:hypothetical protein KAW38_05070 [Candidatus Micrarchaeota archaeon]|nr:hypothetical protein [Candidatus Micrarchaeota archaeon]
MDTSALEDIGLTGVEIKVYLALLELGSSSAGPIVKRSNLQNAVVHRALHSLGEKGLVTYVLEGRKRSYQCINPRSISDFIEDKKKRFEEILPELLARQNTAGKKPEATIYRGIRGIKEMLNYLVQDSPEEYDSYGGSKPQQERLGDYFWRHLHNRRIKNKTKARIIFQPSLRYWGKELDKKPLTKVRYTKKEIEPLQETVIGGNKVAIIVYTEKPYGFLIEDSIPANSYRKFFDMLWKEAGRG